MKACCVTGHRDIANEKIDYVTIELRKAIQEAISDGFSVFISGFALGTDMIFAKLVIELQTDYPQIQLQAALPYETWFKNRSMEDKSVLEKCIGIGIHSSQYTRACFFIRNRFMVDTCERVIVVYDGRGKGGTFNTMRYAVALKRDLRTIKI